MLDNEDITTEESTSIANKRKWYIIVSIGVALLITILIGENYNNNKQFNTHVALAEQYFNEDEPSKAIENYEIALGLKFDSTVQDKLDLSRKVEVSSSKYSQAIVFFNAKDYLSAYNNFKEVIPEDGERYSLAQTKIIESRRLCADNQLAEARQSFIDKDYLGALSCISVILLVDGQNPEAVALKPIYTEAWKQQRDAQYAPTSTVTPTPPLNTDELIISQLNWNNGPRSITRNGITYEITRKSLPIDMRAGTGVSYEEEISKINYDLPLKKRVRTVISSKVIY